MAGNNLGDPRSRNEAILMSMIDGTEYTAEPQSRIEALLLELKNAGGGGSNEFIITEDESMFRDAYGEYLEEITVPLVRSEQHEGYYGNIMDEVDMLSGIIDLNNAYKAVIDGTTLYEYQPSILGNDEYLLTFYVGDDAKMITVNNTTGQAYYVQTNEADSVRLSFFRVYTTPLPAFKDAVRQVIEEINAE